MNSSLRCRSNSRWFASAFALIVVSANLSAAHAQLVVPAGGSVRLGGASYALGCTDLRVAGNVVLGSDAELSGVRDAVIDRGGALDISGASVQLAQQFTNNGTVTEQGGTVTRVDSADCPAVGKLGAVAVAGTDVVPVTAAAVPTVHGLALWALVLLVGVVGSAFARRPSHRGVARKA